MSKQVPKRTHEFTSEELTNIVKYAQEVKINIGKHHTGSYLADDILWLVYWIRKMDAHTEAYLALIAGITKKGLQAFAKEKKGRLWSEAEDTTLTTDEKDERLTRFLHRRAFLSYPIEAIKYFFKQLLRSMDSKPQIVADSAESQTTEEVQPEEVQE